MRDCSIVLDGDEIAICGRLFAEPWCKPKPRASPDGQYLVTAVFAVFGEGADLKDTQRTKVLQRFHGHNGNIRAVAFDGAGAKLATGGSDGCIQVWDLANPERSITKASTNGPGMFATA